MPEEKGGSYLIGLFPDAGPQPNRSALDERIVYLDQYTAELLGDYRYTQFGPLGKATDLGISLHGGREWGLVSQLLSLAGALAILISASTAVVMWRKRRPKGLGAPRKEPSRQLRAGVIVITVALGALLPSSACPCSRCWRSSSSWCGECLGWPRHSAPLEPKGKALGAA